MNDKNENVLMEKISELLKKGPTDDGTFYGTLYDLYVLINVAKGVRDVSCGNSISLEELHKEMEALYESTGRRFG